MGIIWFGEPSLNAAGPITISMSSNVCKTNGINAPKGIKCLGSGGNNALQAKTCSDIWIGLERQQEEGHNTPPLPQEVRSGERTVPPSVCSADKADGPAESDRPAVGDPKPWSGCGAQQKCPRLYVFETGTADVA